MQLLCLFGGLAVPELIINIKILLNYSAKQSIYGHPAGL
jgi:hypothetical protein